MRCFAAFILLLSVVSGTVAQTTNNSLTDEQRKEIIRLADVYSANPGDASLDQQATAVAKLLITPEFPICADHLPWVEKKKYKYAHEISVAYYLGGGSYVVQHPGTRSSLLYYPASLSASQAAVRAYQAIQQQDPGAKLDKMDDWIVKQQPGQFAAYLRDKCPWPNPALKRPKGPITAEEKQRILELAGRLQQMPLDPALRPEYQELFVVVIQATDLTVEICTASTPWMDDKPEYKYGPDLMALNLIAMAAYILQNPETGKDGASHNRAGLTASLRGYEAILKQEPAAQSKALDNLLSMEKQGGLDNWFRAQYAKKCVKK